MTTVPTNPIDPAAGGRVWQPNNFSGKYSNTVFGKIINRINGMNEMTAIIIVFAAFVLPPVLIFAIGGPPPATVIEATKNTIQIEYSGFNPGAAEEKIKPWVPTALGLDEATVIKVLLSSVKDNATGTVLLVNGEAVTFTLHNYDHTFTVTKE